MAVRLHKLLQELNSILDRRVYGGTGHEHPLENPPSPIGKGPQIGWHFEHFLRAPLERIAFKYGYEVELADATKYPDLTFIDKKTDEKIAIEIKSSPRKERAGGKKSLSNLTLGRYQGSIGAPSSDRHTQYKYEDYKHHIVLVAAYDPKELFGPTPPPDAARFGGVIGNVEIAAQLRHLCIDSANSTHLFAPRRIRDLEEIRSGQFAHRQMVHAWHGERDVELWCRYGNKDKGLASWGQMRKEHISELSPQENPYSCMSSSERAEILNGLIDDLHRDLPNTDIASDIFAILESGYIPTKLQIEALDEISEDLFNRAKRTPKVLPIAVSTTEALLSIYTAEEDMFNDMFSRVFPYPELLEEYLLHPTMHRTPKLKQYVIGQLLRNINTIKNDPRYKEVVRYISYDRRWHSQGGTGGRMIELLEALGLDEDRFVLDGVCRGAEKWNDLHTAKMLGRLVQKDPPRIIELFNQKALPYMKDIPADFLLENLALLDDSEENEMARIDIMLAYSSVLRQSKPKEVYKLVKGVTNPPSPPRTQKKSRGDSKETRSESKKRTLSRLNK